jgi:signal transduction histidine kinase
MRERIGNIGGKMKVTSSRGKGTRIEVIAPVMAAEVTPETRVLAGESGVVARGA